MLHASSQKFIQLFLDGKLKSEIINEWNNNHSIMNEIIEDLDSIIDTIQLNSAFTKYDKSQIIYQLLSETSYNYWHISTLILYMYERELSKKPSVPGPMWDIFINLYNQTKQNLDLIGELSCKYYSFLLELMDIQSSNRSPDVFDRFKFDNKKVNYSILKSINDKNDFETDYEEIKRRIKLISIYIHRIFNNLSERNKCISTILETLLCFYKIYIMEFRFINQICYFDFPQKDIRLFINIFADMLIKLFMAYQNNPNVRVKWCTGEDHSLDFILSKWHLLNNRNKQFIKENSKQLVSILIHGDLHYCENEKELLIHIINKLEK